MAHYKSLRFNVTNVMQAEGNEPVEMNWARETDALGAAHAVLGILDLRDDSPYAPNLISIKVEVV